MEVRGGNGLRGIVARIGPRGGRIVNRDYISGVIHHIGIIAGTLRHGGDGLQVRARDVFADALVGEGEVGVASFHHVRNHGWSRDVEAELIAAQQTLIAAILADLMRHRVERIVAEILEHATVPVEQRTVTAGLGRTIGAQAQVACQ